MIESTLTTILNGLSVAEYFGYVFYILLGMLVAYLAEYRKYSKPIQRSGGFKKATWIQDNWRRVLLSLICIHIVAVFMEKIVGDKSIWAALIIGATFGYTVDGLIDMLVKRKK